VARGAAAGRRAELHRQRAARRVERALAELASRGARALPAAAFASTVAAVAAGDLDAYTAAATLWHAIGREGS